MPAKAAPKKTEKKPSDGGSSGSKAKKKKWSKGKVRDKLNNMVGSICFVFGSKTLNLYILGSIR